MSLFHFYRKIFILIDAGFVLISKISIKKHSKYFNFLIFVKDLTVDALLPNNTSKYFRSPIKPTLETFVTSGVVKLGTINGISVLDQTLKVRSVHLDCEGQGNATLQHFPLLIDNLYKLFKK